MILREHTIRIRYAETDRMGYAYHGHYAEFFEIARTEWCRKIGLTYKRIEENGILMPVTELNIRYRRPARYDDLITFKVYLKEKPDRRMHMEAEAFNQDGELTTTFSVQLAFLDAKTMRPVRCPDFITETINEHWQSNPA